jgi:hypothetical protein
MRKNVYTNFVVAAVVDFGGASEESKIIKGWL